MAPKKTEPPGKAEAPENTPGATDGQPNEDELRRRREAKASNSASIAARAQQDDDDTGDGEQAELFSAGFLEGEDKVSLKTLIKPGATVERSASMGTAAIPIKGNGFFDVESEVTLLVRCLPGGPVPIATRKKGDEKHKIEKWRINQPLTPIYVESAADMYTREQVVDMLHSAGVAAATVSKLLGEENIAQA